MYLDRVSFASAVLFILTSIFGVISYERMRNRSHFDYNTMKGLDPTYIQEEFAFRVETRNLELTYGILSAVTWFALLIPLLKVSWILSCQGTRQLSVHVSIAALAVGGSVSEMLARLLQLGAHTTTEWLAKDFNMDNWLSSSSDISDTTNNDDIGWRVLEMIHTASYGLTLWVDAIEWLFLFGIFTLICWSVRGQTATVQTTTTTTFHPKWGYFGAVLGVLCILDFAASVLRFQSWRKFSKIVFAISSVNRLLLIPIWLMWLARQLPVIEENAIFRNDNDFGASKQQDETNVEMSENLSDDGKDLANVVL